MLSRQLPDPSVASRAGAGSATADEPQVRSTIFMFKQLPEKLHVAVRRLLPPAALISGLDKYLDALDDRRGHQVIQEKNPLRNIEIIHEESSPHSIEEYIADMKRDFPDFADIWNEVWDEEISHNVKMNESGVVVDKMLASVETMMIENLINEFAPISVTAKIPILSFYALGKLICQSTQKSKKKHSMNFIEILGNLFSSP